MINENQERLLDSLREKISEYMSGRRLSHTLAVEREIVRLCTVYSDADEYIMRAAALLHDITKELPIQNQLQLCDEFGIIYTRQEILTPKIFHSRTAPAVIRRDFPELASDELISAVRWHTTGHEGMALGEILLFLADYIEDTRTFESCVELRNFFYDGIDNGKDKVAHLNDTMILAFDFTIRELCEEKQLIHADTVAARNDFIMKGRLVR